MTMTFSLHENFGLTATQSQFEPSRGSSRKTGKIKEEALRIFAEKIRVPEFGKAIRLTRLIELLAKSSDQFGATLIAGRAGTGKTALAADFARQYKKVAWYSIESADCDWSVFSNYLSASLLGEDFDKDKFSENLGFNEKSGQRAISKYLTGVFSKIGESLQQQKETQMLIVLDDVHYIFDCDWFGDFFNLLLFSAPPNVHLLLLCRSKPALPLWRLRSKQILNVIDEKLLSLNFAETEAFYRNLGLSKESAQKAYRDSFGRISKLMRLANSDMVIDSKEKKAF